VYFSDFDHQLFLPGFTTEKTNEVCLVSRDRAANMEQYEGFPSDDHIELYACEKRSQIVAPMVFDAVQGKLGSASCRKRKMCVCVCVCVCVYWLMHACLEAVRMAYDEWYCSNAGNPMRRACCRNRKTSGCNVEDIGRKTLLGNKDNTVRKLKRIADAMRSFGKLPASPALHRELDQQCSLLMMMM
jgi:hypothetical protein